MRSGVILVLLIFLTSQAWGVDLSSVNFSHLYDPDSPVKLRHRVIQYQKLDVRLSINFSVSDTSQYEFTLIVQQGYTDKSEEVLVERSINAVSDVHYDFQYEVDLDSSRTLLVVKLRDVDGKDDYYFDIPIDGKLNFPYPQFIPMLAKDSQVVFDDYVDERESVFFGDSSIVAFRYIEDFPAATPPMSTTPAAGKDLEIDSLITSSSTFEIERDKFYFFQKDTTSFSGIGLLGGKPRYPKPVTLDDIIDPLLYISTSKEYNDFKTSENRKITLDNFWIDVTGQKERALGTIKRYYQRIKEANEKFTTYKQGWKTDKGMVYIIFGTPTKVTKYAIQESWEYKNLIGSEDIIFTFNKVKNIFTDDHYTLERQKGYSNIWFRQVDLWRKGRI